MPFYLNAFSVFIRGNFSVLCNELQSKVYQETLRRTDIILNTLDGEMKLFLSPNPSEFTIEQIQQQLSVSRYLIRKLHTERNMVKLFCVLREVFVSQFFFYTVINSNWTNCNFPIFLSLCL